MDDSELDINRRKLLASIGATGALGLAGCLSGDGDSNDGDATTSSGTTTTTTTSSSQDTVKAGWAYLTQPGDHGWTYQHHQAVQAVDEKFDWVEVTTTNQVSNQDVGQVMRQYATGGQDIAFGTSFGFMDTMYQVAEEYSDTLFEHCAGFRTNDNMGRYFVHMDQTYYLAGIAAGMMTEEDTLGFLAPFPIAEVLRFINAFALGSRVSNDEVTTKIRWMNAWYDPSGATEAARSLVDEGADVVTGAMDTPAMVESAVNEGAWAIGANSPMAEFGGDRYITSVIYNWEPFYTETLKAVRDGTWESDFYWGDITEDGAKLDEWGPQVPSEVKDAVESEREALASGETTIWEGSQFEGEDDTFLFQEMGSLVPAVDGEIP